MTDPHRMIMRLGELAPEAADHVLDQHVVSKVLLKRFAGQVPSRQGFQVGYLNLAHLNAKAGFVGPDGVGKIPNFIGYASRSAEQLWSRTEVHLAEALQRCESGTIFDDGHLLTVVKDAIALHLVRSPQTLAVHRWAFESTRREQLEAWRADPAALTAAYHDRTGLVVVGPDGMNAAAEALLEPFDQVMESGVVLRAGIEDVFANAREIVANYLLAIAIASGADELLIGDTPALPVIHSLPGVEPVDGLPMEGANSIVLPLGPHHLALLSRSSGYHTLATEWVRAFNQLQVLAAEKFVYFRPGSSLDSFIRSTRASRPEQPGVRS
jgi:hypothetical protein